MAGSRAQALAGPPPGVTVRHVWTTACLSGSRLRARASTQAFSRPGTASRTLVVTGASCTSAHDDDRTENNDPMAAAPNAADLTRQERDRKLPLGARLWLIGAAAPGH